jgi:hypothetical protein
VVSIVTHLLPFETRLCRARGRALDAIVLVTMKGRGQHSNGGKGNDRMGEDRIGDGWKSQVICHGWAIQSHITAKCTSKPMWSSLRKSQSDAILASTALTSTAEIESASFRISVIHSYTVLYSARDPLLMVNVASAK